MPFAFSFLPLLAGVPLEVPFGTPFGVEACPLLIAFFAEPLGVPFGRRGRPFGVPLGVACPFAMCIAFGVPFGVPLAEELDSRSFPLCDDGGDGAAGAGAGAGGL